MFCMIVNISDSFNALKFHWMAFCKNFIGLKLLLIDLYNYGSLFFLFVTYTMHLATMLFTLLIKELIHSDIGKVRLSILDKANITQVLPAGCAWEVLWYAIFKRFFKTSFVLNFRVLFLFLIMPYLNLGRYSDIHCHKYTFLQYTFIIKLDCFLKFYRCFDILRKAA